METSDTIAIVGIIISAIGLIISLGRWLWPREPIPRNPTRGRTLSANFISILSVPILILGLLWLLPSPPSLPSRLSATVQMKITSKSDWVEIMLADHANAVVPKKTEILNGEAKLAKMENDLIELDQELWRAERKQTVTMLQNITFDGLPVDRRIGFRLQKGCLGTVEVRVFNLATNSSVPVTVHEPEYLKAGAEEYVMTVKVEDCSNSPDTYAIFSVDAQSFLEEGWLVQYWRRFDAIRQRVLIANSL